MVFTTTYLPLSKVCHYGLTTHFGRKAGKSRSPLTASSPHSLGIFLSRESWSGAPGRNSILWDSRAQKVLTKSWLPWEIYTSHLHSYFVDCSLNNVVISHYRGLCNLFAEVKLLLVKMLRKCTLSFFKPASQYNSARSNCKEKPAITVQWWRSSLIYGYGGKLTSRP